MLPGGGQEPVAHIGFDGAQQEALRPAAVMGQGAVNDPRDVFSGYVGPQAAHMGYPILRGLVQGTHVAVLSRQPHPAQRGGVLGAKPGVAARSRPLAKAAIGG